MYLEGDPLIDELGPLVSLADDWDEYHEDDSMRASIEAEIIERARRFSHDYEARRATGR